MRGRRKNWSLKIEQQEIEESTKRKKYSAKIKISLEILKRILLKQKVKEARKESSKDWNTSIGVILIQLIESLILAQDERWRRA